MVDISALSRIPVSPGMTPTTYILIAILITLLGGYIKQIVPWRKQRDEADKSLRTALTERVDKLEKTLGYERDRHEAERTADRHKIRNLMQCVDFMLVVWKTAPGKAEMFFEELKAMRDRQVLAEEAEEATIRAADVVAKAQGIL